MQIDFFDIDKFCENLKEVNSNKIYARRDFHEQGLFSQKIFGPIKNYTCGCGTYFGRSKAGQICKICGVEITHSSERRKRFAKIKLPFAVCNPVMYYILCKIGKVSIKDVLSNLLLSEATIGYWYNEDAKRYIQITENDSIPEGKTIYSGITGAYEIAKALAMDRKDDNPDWKFIFDNIEKFYMNNVIVLPPAFRPTSKTKDVQKRDQLNDSILTILNFTLTKNEELLDSDKESKIHSTNFTFFI